MPLHQSFTRPPHRRIIILGIMEVNSIMHCFCLYQAKMCALTFFSKFHLTGNMSMCLLPFRPLNLKSYSPFGICMFVAAGLWSFLSRTLINRNSTFRRLYKGSLTKAQYTCLTHWLHKQLLP